MENSAVKALHDWVRNMPFEPDFSGRDYQEKIWYVLHRKRGGCSAKHYFLGSLCKGLDIKVTYLTYPFLWGDLKVAYPDYLRKLAEKMPTQYHLALEAEIKGRAVFVDATWDPKLAKASFPINKFGKAQNAVVPCAEPLRHQSITERERKIKELRSEIKTDFNVIQEFYVQLGQWLREVRRQ